MRGKRAIRLVLAIALVVGATAASLAGLRVQAVEPADVPEITGVPVPSGRGPILVPIEDTRKRSPEPRQLP